MKRIYILTLFLSFAFMLNAQIDYSNRSIHGRSADSPVMTLAADLSTRSSYSPLENAIITSPENIFLGLSIREKQKLLGNPSDTSLTVSGEQGQKIKRIAINEDFIAVRSSAAGTIQIKLLPLINNTYIYCVVKTVCVKVCDSSIEFFSPDWKPIERKLVMPMLGLKNFVKDGINTDSQEYHNAAASIDILPIKLVLSSIALELKATLDINNYLSTDERDGVVSILKDEELVFSWDKLSFK